ncbi:IPT/TIG domain-containing protein [Hymenobacter sp. BT178]|uniref:IPT/TIG domain-containing protein n=1 Tax=Hymenobacter lucidus TaxID=2880930 RepID=A0ABS8ANE1_9BACT|nr:IPT/TIG domain-containing protein [Hymenobacter lucidus]
MLATFTTASAQLRNFRLERMLGTPVDFPQDIQVSSAGVVHVLDRVGLVKLDATGRYQQTIPLRSATRTPDYRALALDGQSNVFVVNRAQSFVRKYSPAGDSLTQIGQAGTAVGQFQQPEGITVDAAGNIYVADTGNNRLQKLNASGQVQWVYAPGGTQALVQPSDVKVAPDGSVYVLNKNYTAVKLNAAGQLLSTVSLRFTGSVNDQTIGLEIDAAGNLYVVSSRLTAVQRYDAQGVHLGAFGSGSGSFNGTHAALALDGTGYVYALDASDREQSISTIRKLSSTGAQLGKWGNESVFGGRMRQDEAGNIYYLDQKQPRIVKINPAGQQVATFGTAGQGDGQFGMLTSFAVDLYGNVYGLEGQGYPPRVQKFDPQGRFISKIALPNPQTNSNGYWPTDLAVDAGGNVYVLDYYSAVRKYNAQGQMVQMIGAGGSGSGPGPGQFYAPRGVVLDYRGNIYVSDGAGSRVQKFNPAGQVVREFLSMFPPSFQGSPSLSPGDAGLAVDGAGNVYASVGKDNYVTMFEGNSTRQVKLVVGASPSVITVNQSGTRLTTARWAHDVLRFYSPTNRPPENLLTGKVFNDLNNDCVQQSNEPAMPNMVVVAEPGSAYALTDDNGNYSLALDTGAYTVQQLLPPPQTGRVIEELCAGPAAVSFHSYGNAASGPDFGNQVSTAPHLTVSVASNRRRRCFQNTTAVSYANTGFAAVPNATVTVALPPEVIFVRADMPHTLDAAGNYVFRVGALQPNQRGTITIQDSVVCGNPALRGLTVCTRAWIRPVNTYPVPSGWNRASMAVRGQVTGSSQVRFVVRNQGSGATTDSLGLRIFQDAELAMMRNISLAAGDSVVLRWTAAGPVVRVEADQPANHPYGPMASATVELAALRTNSLPSTAMESMSPGDPEPEVAEDCQPILDSYDPNDKRVVPQGRTAQHYTPTTEALRYQIRFQNTGNDVAYQVAVVDTLSADLDLRTLQVGAVSHPYRMTISGRQRPIVTFTFPNIMLPDSASNPAGSNGFVQFSIKPKAALPARTRIDNFADIYFDYNEPVRTDTTTNRIYDMPLNVVPAVALSYPEVLASPTITALAPAQGRFGTLVTLTGSKFSPTPTSNRVMFNGVAASVQSATATTLTVRVPAGATTGTLTLTTTDGGTRSSSFTVFQPPTLTSVTPGEGQPGAAVTLTGTHFSALTAQDTVTFNGIPARVLQATTSGLQVEVPTGATLGKIRIRTLGGQVESAQSFMVWYPPTISSTLPGRAHTGATVALTGTHFADALARNVVTFGGGQVGQVLQASATRLVVKVPTAAQTGPVQVQTPGGQTTTATSLVVIPAPVITSFSPAHGPVGTAVTIIGRNFREEGLNDTILFGGLTARVVRATATSAEVVVPRGASTGTLTAAGAGGRGQSGEVFSVSALPLNEAVAVYPNPTHDKVTISWRQADFVVQQVRIYNTIGGLVATEVVSSATSDELTIPLTHCRAGVYVAVIDTPAGRVVKRITLL